RVKIRRHANSCGGRFEQITKLASPNLASLGGPEHKCFAVDDAPLTFSMAPAFHRAAVELFVLLVELVDFSGGDEFLIECRPCLFVKSGKDQMRPRLGL